MALPKIDTPIFYIKLPLSGKEIKFRPFLVKEQKNLLMALEADDKETIESFIEEFKQFKNLKEHSIGDCLGMGAYGIAFKLQDLDGYVLKNYRNFFFLFTYSCLNKQYKQQKLFILFIFK